MAAEPVRRGAGEGRAQGPHQEGEHGDAGDHLDAVVRRREPARGAGRPARRHRGDDRHGPWRQHRHPHARGRRRAWRRSTSWSSPIRTRRPSRRCPTGATAPTSCRSRPRSNATARARPRTARCNGARRSSSRPSSRRTTTRSMYLLAKKLGFAERMFKNIKVERHEAGGRGHPARAQSRRLVDRLLRAVAGAPQGAYEEPGQVRSRDAARAEGRSGGRRRLLRPALAVLGQAGDPPSRARRSSTTPTFT